jgi:OOP family OmpA-OmpF porin
MSRHLRRLLLAPLALAATLVPSVASADLGPPPLQKPKYHLEGNRVVLPERMAFKFEKGKETMVPASLRAVARLKEYMEEKTYVTTLRIEGHVGPSEGLAADAAQTLSEARALRIAREMVAMGVDCKRLLPVGFGPTKPVAPAKSPSNSRVEAHNAALRERAIGGMPLDGGGRVAGDPCAE